MLNILEVTDCVRVDRDPRVKLLYKGSGSGKGLPQWFRHRKDCRLTRKSMMENISLKKFICKKIYIISEENRGSIELSSKSSNSRKKEYFAQCYSIFTSSALYLQTHRLLMKE